MKILGKFFALITLITGAYLLLAQVNWTGIFQVEENSQKLEKKLGKLVFNNIKSTNDLLDNDSISTLIDSIALPVLKGNDISKKNYKFMVIQDQDINAFALPDDYILITTGLIQFLDSADYLSAIIAHEVAHCEKNHVMKGLVTNFGLNVLLSGSGTGEITNFLTGQAFSRKLEKEADETAVQYLIEAKINPKSLSHVMQLFDIHLGSSDDVSWVSSHPNSADRVKYIDKEIENLSSGNEKYKNVIQQSSWIKLQELVEEMEED